MCNISTISDDSTGNFYRLSQFDHTHTLQWTELTQFLAIQCQALKGFDFQLKRPNKTKPNQNKTDGWHCKRLAFICLSVLFTRCDLKLQKFLSLLDNDGFCLGFFCIFFFFLFDRMFIIEWCCFFCYYSNGLLTTLETKQQMNKMESFSTPCCSKWENSSPLIATANYDGNDEITINRG